MWCNNLQSAHALLPLFFNKILYIRHLDRDFYALLSNKCRYLACPHSCSIYLSHQFSVVVVCNSPVAVVVGDMSKSPSSQYGLKAQEDIDPRGIRVTNEPMR